MHRKKRKEKSMKIKIKLKAGKFRLKSIEIFQKVQRYYAISIYSL